MMMAIQDTKDVLEQQEQEEEEEEEEGEEVTRKVLGWATCHVMSRHFCPGRKQKHK